MLKLCSKKNYPAGYQLEMKAGPAVECYDKIVTSKDLGVRTGTMTKICEQRSTVSLLWKLCVKVLWKSMKIITTIQYQRLTHTSYTKQDLLKTYLNENTSLSKLKSSVIIFSLLIFYQIFILPNEVY